MHFMEAQLTVIQCNDPQYSPGTPVRFVGVNVTLLMKWVVLNKHLTDCGHWSSETCRHYSKCSESTQMRDLILSMVLQYSGYSG